MAEGWLISVILSNAPTVAVILFLFKVLVVGGVKEIKGFRGLFWPFFGFTVSLVVLLPIVIIVSTVVLFPAVFSFVNLIYVLIGGGFDGLANDLASGVLSLRVCSIVSIFTTINFLMMDFAQERGEYEVYQRFVGSGSDDVYGLRAQAARAEYEDHPATIYSSHAKSAGNSGNLFFFSVIVCLWLQYIFGYESIFFSLASFVLFFIIDDWALLIHFKIHAEKSLTSMHRNRLYASFAAIIGFTFFGAFGANELLLYAAWCLVCIFGLYSLRKMRLEELCLKDLKTHK